MQSTKYQFKDQDHPELHHDIDNETQSRLDEYFGSKFNLKSTNKFKKYNSEKYSKEEMKDLFMDMQMDYIVE